jgi:putative SOS response-associated peptidase YedK
MCARLKRIDDFSERVDGGQMIDALEQLGLSRGGFLQPPARYNITPTSNVAIVKLADDKAQMSIARWGLIRPWSAKPLINARSDGVAEKPTWRKLYQQSRCLVIVDGYYEWMARGKKRFPFLGEVEGGNTFAIAGLWENAGGENGERHERCTIIITEPNATAAAAHDRMPVILDACDYAAWLDPVNNNRSALLVPYSGHEFTVRPVSQYVNDVRHEGPECIAPPEWDVEAAMRMPA